MKNYYRIPSGVIKHDDGDGDGDGDGDTSSFPFSCRLHKIPHVYSNCQIKQLLPSVKSQTVAKALHGQ